MNKPGDAWRAHMAGVGGMGIGVINAILVRAGHKEGYHVIFADKKGLAIRNGGVYSQITFVQDDVIVEGTRGRRDAASRMADAIDPAVQSGDSSVSEVRYPTTGSIPYGKADLLIGIDILEAARAHRSARAIPRGLCRPHLCRAECLQAADRLYPAGQAEILIPKPCARKSSTIASQSIPLPAICRNCASSRLGSKLYANIMLLGVAFQLGLIPVSQHSIAWAIKDSIRRDHRKNMKAFNIGRRLALEPRALPKKPEPETWEQLVTNKVRILRKTRFVGRACAMSFERLVQGAMKQMRDLPETAKYDLTLRVYDLMQYENYAFAKRYLELVRGIYRRDSADRAYAATLAAIWNLAKVMLIKDEVVRLLPFDALRKETARYLKYGVDVSNGDHIVYRTTRGPSSTSASIASASRSARAIGN